MLFCYNYTLSRTDDNVSIQLNKIKSHKRLVHLLFMVSTFATVYYQYVVLSILHKDYKTLIAKHFLSCFASTWDFLTRSIIYMQPGTRPICSLPNYYNTNTLPEISTSVFFFFFALAVAYVWNNNKKAIQLLPHLSEILTYNLQPVTCNLQFTPSVCHGQIKTQVP